MSKTEAMELTLKLLLNHSNFDSILDYYGEYYICFEKLGSEVRVPRDVFDLLSTMLPAEKIVRS
jgi:hypothetical protein